MPARLVDACPHQRPLFPASPPCTPNPIQSSEHRSQNASLISIRRFSSAPRRVQNLCLSIAFPPYAHLCSSATPAVLTDSLHESRLCTRAARTATSASSWNTFGDEICAERGASDVYHKVNEESCLTPKVTLRTQPTQAGRCMPHSYPCYSLCSAARVASCPSLLA